MYKYHLTHAQPFFLQSIFFFLLVIWSRHYYKIFVNNAFATICIDLFPPISAYRLKSVLNLVSFDIFICLHHTHTHQSRFYMFPLYIKKKKKVNDDIPDSNDISLIIIHLLAKNSCSFKNLPVRWWSLTVTFLASGMMVSAGYVYDTGSGKKCSPPTLKYALACEKTCKRRGKRKSMHLYVNSTRFLEIFSCSGAWLKNKKKKNLRRIENRVLATSNIARVCCSKEQNKIFWRRYGCAQRWRIENSCNSARV